MISFWLKHLFKVYYKHKHLSIRLMKFSSVGLLGFVVDSSFYFLLNYLGLPHLIARTISYWITATNNWFFNRIFTFDYAFKAPKLAQWIKYLSVALVSFFLNWGSYYYLTEYTFLLQNYKFVAFIIGVGVGFIFNFIMSNYIVFKHKKSS